jgi:putative transposase
MLRAIKIRLYPNKNQEIYISKLLGCYRFVYNQCLDRKIKAYTNNKVNLGLKDLGNFFHQELTKNEEYDWLSEHNTKVLKQTIINLLDSYKRFFVNGNGFPKFKSKHDNNQSCRFPLEAISKVNDYSTNKLTLTSQLKNLHFKCSDKYKNYLVKHKDGIKSSTLTKTKSGNYFLSILIDGDLMRIYDKPINNIVGIDLGIKDFIVTSENQIFKNIKIKRNNQKKLIKLNRTLSRKQKDSRNKNKARVRLAKFHEKINNKKENYLHQVSNQLLNENQIIVMENLGVKNMMSNHNLARSIQELSLYHFKEILRYKSKWTDRDIVEVDRFYPSSKLCSNCGYKNNELTLKDREWTCPECGKSHNRDLNAAINIKNEGLKLYNNKIPIRCGEFKPLESSQKTLDELGNKNYTSERSELRTNFL